MPKYFRVLSGTTGLNTKIDPARLDYNPKTGVQELAVAVNVSIEDTGRVSRRKGYTKQASGSFHSPFCYGADAVVVKDDALCVLHPDYTTTPIRNLTPGPRVSYCQVDNAIYYTNGYERGKLKTGGNFDGLSYAWNQTEYVGPETDRVLTGPPTGTLLEYFGGRMWVAQGKTVWYSEPFNVSVFDLARNALAYEDNVVMVRATVNGLYVSTDKQVFYHGGADPGQMAERVVADYPAIAWTDVPIVGRIAFARGGEAYVRTVGGASSVMWQSTKGICFGGPDGEFFNLTEHKIDLPSALSGAGFVWDGKYIGNMNP